jgi:hypothetical protein
MTKTVDIPIAAGKRIAEEYGYDQVVIVARKVGDGGREHVTTYGVDKAHCSVAARMGDFFKHKLMGWPDPPPQSADSATKIVDDPCALILARIAQDLGLEGIDPPAVRDAVLRLRVDVANLRGFADELLSDWPDVGGADGFDLQLWGLKHGLLEMKTPKPTAPCSEHCNCVEYHGSDPKDWADGVECYRKTARLKGYAANGPDDAPGF